MPREDPKLTPKGAQSLPESPLDAQKLISGEVKHLPCENAVFWSRGALRLNRFGVHFGKGELKKQASMFDIASEYTFSPFLYFWAQNELQNDPPKGTKTLKKLPGEPIGAR